MLPTDSRLTRALRESGARVFVVDGTALGAGVLGERLGRIRAAHASAPILLLSGADREALRAALNQGVTGVLAPDSDAETCVKALQQLSQGHSWLPAELVGDLLNGRVPGATGSLLDRLSPRQRQVMDLLGNGMTTRQIADLLGIGVKTVETHRARLMQQLGARSAHELLVLAVQGRQAAGY